MIILCVYWIKHNVLLISSMSFDFQCDYFKIENDMHGSHFIPIGSTVLVKHFICMAMLVGL